MNKLDKPNVADKKITTTAYLYYCKRCRQYHMSADSLWSAKTLEADLRRNKDTEFVIVSPKTRTIDHE